MKKEDVELKAVLEVLNTTEGFKDPSLRIATAERLLNAVHDAFTPAQNHERSFTVSVRNNILRYENGDFLLESMTADPDAHDATFDALDKTIRKSIAGVP